jgi:hypothetical protein
LDEFEKNESQAQEIKPEWNYRFNLKWNPLGVPLQNPYPRNFLRLLHLAGQAKRQEHGAKRKTDDVRSHEFSSLLTLCSLPHAHCDFSPNYPVRPRQHIRRDGQTDPLRRLQIDVEFELARASR